MFKGDSPFSSTKIMDRNIETPLLKHSIIPPFSLFGRIGEKGEGGNLLYGKKTTVVAVRALFPLKEGERKRTDKRAPFPLLSPFGGREAAYWARFSLYRREGRKRGEKKENPFCPPFLRRREGGEAETISPPFFPFSPLLGFRQRQKEGHLENASPLVRSMRTDRRRFPSPFPPPLCIL